MGTEDEAEPVLGTCALAGEGHEHLRHRGCIEFQAVEHYTEEQWEAAGDSVRRLREKLLASPRAKEAYDRVLREIEERRTL